MCSKSVSSSTCRVPPFLPPVSDCVVGFWNSPVLSFPDALGVPLAPLELGVELVLLDPHAASTSPSTATSAIAATDLIDLIETPPVLCTDCPRRGCRHQAFLGFRASLSPSPSRLKASTVNSSAR